MKIITKRDRLYIDGHAVTNDANAICMWRVSSRRSSLVGDPVGVIAESAAEAVATLATLYAAVIVFDDERFDVYGRRAWFNLAWSGDTGGMRLHHTAVAKQMCFSRGLIGTAIHPELSKLLCVAHRLHWINKIRAAKVVVIKREWLSEIVAALGAEVRDA